MTTQIVPSNGNKALSRYGDLDSVRGLCERYKLMIANGKKLQDAEALALAQYSIATGLNAFLGECYYLSGVGPGPGIAGWRRKADEQIEYEAKRAGEPLGRWWTEYSEPSADEVGDLNKGDIAVKSILHDTLSNTHWQRRYLTAFLECRKVGVDKDEAKDMATQLAGAEPVWSAVGIVRAGENFGGDKMNRYERACKRADKAAIKKRFSRIDLPEPEGFDPSLIVDVTPTDAPERPKMSEAEIMSDLGFAPNAPVMEQKPAEGEYHDPAELDIDPAEVVYLDACEMLTPNGKRFGDLSLEDLQYCVDNAKKYKAEQVTAAKNILDWRKEHA